MISWVCNSAGTRLVVRCEFDDKTFGVLDGTDGWDFPKKCKNVSYFIPCVHLI